MTIRSIVGKDASFSIYEDGDTVYDYEKGAFSNINVIYNEAKRKLSIMEKNGKFSCYCLKTGSLKLYGYPVPNQKNYN